MRPTRRAGLLTLLLATGGCYTQVPLDTFPPAPATHVLAQLTDSGTYVMSNTIGSGVVAIEGIFVAADKNVWQLNMVSAEQKDGRSVPWNRELVSFPRNALTQLQVRTLDRKRSWIAAGGILLGSLALSRAFNLLGSNDSKDETPSPAASVILGGGK